MATSIKINWFRKYIFWNYRSYTALRFKLRRKLTRRGVYLIAALFIGGCMGIDTNRIIAYQGFALIAALILVALVTRRIGRLRFSAERLVPRFGTVGQRLPYRVRVQNHTQRAQSGLTLYEDTEDPRPNLTEFVLTPEPGEEKRNRFDRFYGYYRWVWILEKKLVGTVEAEQLENLPPEGSVDHTMTATPLKRGKFRLEGVTIGWTDPFGLFRSLASVETTDEILILPKRYPVPDLALPGNSTYQVGGVSLAGAVGESEEFVALRDYRPGDPLRRIHWRSTARVGKPIVKEYQDEYFVRHALVLDTFLPLAVSDRFEEAVSVASSFVCSVEDSDSLLDLMFVGNEAYCFTTGRGLAYSEQMLEILATVQPNLEGDFSSLKEMVVDHLGAVSGVICVFVDWDEERERMVKAMQSRKVPVHAYLVRDEGAEPDSSFLGAGGPMDSFIELRVGEIEKGLVSV